MASKIERELIDNLQNFTESLGNIVELMKEQSKKKVDVVNNLSSSIDGEKLSKITEDMKELLNISKQTNNRTKEILKEIRAIKQQKEKGIFENIQSKENKAKIIDGVKVIGLISVGVLAIGMAFKIIGKVDFFSVIALSAGIVVVAKAFEMVAQIKDLTPKKAMVAGLSFVVMTGAIVASSALIRFVSPITPIQMFSFLMVGTALGVGTYFLMKSIGKMKIEAKDMAKVLLLPIILPAIAAGIVLSSYLLSNTQPVGLMQTISAIFVGVILGVAAISVALIMKAMHGKSVKDVLLTTMIIPLMATGIVLASIIMQHFEPVKAPFQLLFSAITIGLSLLVFAPTVMLLGKLSLKQMLVGALAIPVISLAIVAASYILQKGDYSGNYPSFKWSLGVGFSILLFALPTMLMGMMVANSGGAGALGLVVGAAMTVVVASAIMLSSYILAQGTYEKFPPLSWAAGVGLSMIAFSVSTLVLGMMAMTGIGAVGIVAGALLNVVIAQSIVATAAVLNNGEYGIYPTFGWAAGVGLSMLAFTMSTLVLGAIALTGIGAIGIMAGAALTVMVAKTIVETASILGKGSYDSYPSLQWAAGVGLSMLEFAICTVGLGLLAVTGVGAIAITQGAAMISTVAQSIVDASMILSKGTYGEYPSLLWASGVGLSLLGFSTGVMLLGAAALTGLGYFAFEAGMGMILTLAGGIKDASILISGGNYSGGPSIEWATGVGLSISAFAQAAKVAMEGGGDIDSNVFSSFMINVAQGMIDVSNKLKEGDWSGGFPSKEWGEGVSASLMPFITAYQLMNERRSFLDSVFGGDDDSFANVMVGIAQSMVKVSQIIKNGDFSGAPSEAWAKNMTSSIRAFTDGLSVLDEDKIDVIDSFADAIKNLADNIKELNLSSLDKLNTLTSSITVLSVIDDKKLQQTLGVLDENKEKLNNLINSKSNQPIQGGKQEITPIIPNNTPSNKQDNESKLLEHIASIDDKFTKLLDNIIQSKTPENVNGGAVT